MCVCVCVCVYMCTLMNISGAVCVYVNVCILCVCVRACVRACVWLACEYMSTCVHVGCYCVDGCGVDTYIVTRTRAPHCTGHCLSFSAASMPHMIVCLSQMVGWSFGSQ